MPAGIEGLPPSTATPTRPVLPASPKRPASDVYHGVTVSEDYRWLEAMDAPEVKDWVSAQNAVTRSVLDGLPQREAIAGELTELLGQAPVTRRALHWAGGRLFALKRQPPANQLKLVVLTDPARAASERVLVDPDRLDPRGGTAIDWFQPSLDGRLVAVCLSEGGSEAGSLHFFDVETGRALPDVLPRVQFPTAGGSVAWSDDHRGVYYTRYPAPGERPEVDQRFFQQVWFHALGTPPSSDRYVLGKDFPRIAEIALTSSEDGRHVLAGVADGDGGDFAWWLRQPSGRWDRLADFSDGVRQVMLGRDGRWYALVLKGSPRGRLVAGALTQPDLARAKLLLPQGEGVMAGFQPTRSLLYVERMEGGPQHIEVYDLAGRPLEGAQARQDVATETLGPALEGDALLFSRQSFVEPAGWHLWNPRSGSVPAPAALQAPQRVDLNEAPKDLKLGDVELLREFATSRDGTKVPVMLVRRRGTPQDGRQPLLLHGYGGYGIAMQPWYSPTIVAWLRHGGIYAVANIRGGGEYGEDWHLAGNLTRKQNVFDDFIASAEHLIAKGYTSAQRLAIEGGSNGGLLMGAVTVQRPELFRAVVSHVGIYDALRSELTPNGAFNVTEFGTVKDEAQFRALHAYSPYHRVVDGTRYPAVLLATGINDGRVEPWHSFKMAARLQASQRQGPDAAAATLLRVDGAAGHGQGSALSSTIALETDVFAFLFERLGMR